jgi:transposase
MIAAGADLKIYIATRPIDFCCGHDGLAAKVQEMLRLDPFSGAAFVFRSKRADRVKILVWDRTGLVLVHKRLEGCKFVLANDRRRRDADIAGDVRGSVRGAGLEVGPPGRSAASPGGWITAAE